MVRLEVAAVAAVVAVAATAAYIRPLAWRLSFSSSGLEKIQ